MPDRILALDIGTTSVRAMVVDAEGQPLSIAARKNHLDYPAAGRVEQDPEALWTNVLAVKKQALADAALSPSDICSIGVAAQRSSIVVWDRKTLAPLAPVISWQDLRGVAAAEALQAEGYLVSHQMAASKLEGVIDGIDNGRARAKAGELAWGNVDTFIIARLTGGKTHAMDLSHLSATGYFNLVDGFNEELVLAQNLDLSLFPTVGDTAQNHGATDPDIFGAITMIGAIVADQQSATIAQGCNRVGLGKVTYGTSGTIDINTGSDLKLATGAYPLVLRNQGDRIEFVLEGMVITAGAMFDWLAGGLELVDDPREIAAIAARVPDSGGVFVLPALQGLGTPYGDPDQRAVIGGLSHGGEVGIRRVSRVPVAEEADADLRHAGDHVVVGQDVALRVEDDPGSHLVAGQRADRRRGRAPGRRRRGGDGVAGDVDHRGAHPGHGYRELLRAARGEHEPGLRANGRALPRPGGGRGERR